MKNLLIVLLFVLAIPMARAGVWIEPYLGYMSGKATATVSVLGGAPTEYKYTYKTPMLGARLGYGMMGLSAGLDYSLSTGSFEYKQDTPATTHGADKDKYTNLGIYVGYKFPLLFRVWGTYFLKSETKTDTVGAGTGSTVGDKVKGKGYALGAGFTGLPLVAINLEYRAITFDEVTDASTGTTTTLPISNALFTESEIKAKEIMLSLSVPFDL